jgi:class 3 adenylate cyclase
MGISEGGALSMLFAATYPERTTALILYGAYAKDDEDPSEEQFREYGERMRRVWGTEEHAKIWAKRMSPSLANDQQFILWLTQASRMWGSPGAAVALARMNAEIDVRHILPTVRVPTLVLHRQNDMAVPASEGRYLAASIPNSKYVELPGVDHLPFAGDGDSVIDEIEEFITGVRDPLERNRVLATVMFTDIVESTERALDLGDRKWREVLENHHGVVRKNLARFRGTEVDTAGDGFFATFDGPARAIRCARAISENVRPLGIEVRAGLHTGECEIIGEKVGGIAVHIGARVLSKAEANQVMVSSTVKDLVAGSGIQFEDRGMHMLKGIPGEWHLYRVSN